VIGRRRWRVRGMGARPPGPDVRSHQ
jgi:hypothetical protein